MLSFSISARFSLTWSKNTQDKLQQQREEIERERREIQRQQEELDRKMREQGEQLRSLSTTSSSVHLHHNFTYIVILMVTFFFLVSIVWFISQVKVRWIYDKSSIVETSLSNYWPIVIFIKLRRAFDLFRASPENISIDKTNSNILLFDLSWFFSTSFSLSVLWTDVSHFSLQQRSQHLLFQHIECVQIVALPLIQISIFPLLRLWNHKHEMIDHYHHKQVCSSISF